MKSDENPILRITALNKFYSGGFQALKDINLQIERGEILALLGPNGAGKTTLISVVCGIVNPSSGSVSVDGFDIIKDFRKTRSIIGLVPQELTTDSFETVFNTVSFSRGLFGKPPSPSHIEKVLRSLSLWDKKDNMIMTLSGGMKRRVLIAKALSHEPTVLFLDEPTAGVDVSLRKDMWQIVRELKEEGVTIILTTHYIEEAEEIADRVGVINNGEIVLIEEKEKEEEYIVLVSSSSNNNVLPPELMERKREIEADLKTMRESMNANAKDDEDVVSYKWSSIRTSAK